MSNLNGTYKNANADATLVITDANDANGTFKGSMTQAGLHYNITGHYHFKNSTGPMTTIAFFAINDDVGYQAWSMYAANMSFPSMKAAGCRAGYNGEVVGLGGEFVRA